MEKEGIVLNRPQALEHSERKPSNAAAGPSALRTEPVWQSQAPGEERGDPARWITNGHEEYGRMTEMFSIFMMNTSLWTLDMSVKTHRSVHI